MATHPIYTVRGTVRKRAPGGGRKSNAELAARAAALDARKDSDVVDPFADLDLPLVPPPGKPGDPMSDVGRGMNAGELSAARELAKFKKEQADANLAELNFSIRSGEFVPRALVRDRAATLAASAVQSLRSIPDRCERDLALPPEVVESIAVQVDAVLAEYAEKLRAMHETL